MKIQSYKELIVWQKSMALVKVIYVITGHFPKEEMFGLTSQMRRAVVAIPSNIAEGYLRRHRKEYIQFLSIALGSVAEIETQILICKSLTQLNSNNFIKGEELTKEVMRMLYAMIDRLK